MSLAKIAVAGALLSAGGFLEPYPEPRDIDPDDLNDIGRTIFGEPAKATFVSEKPLTKRQRRRLRGKAKQGTEQ